MSLLQDALRKLQKQERIPRAPEGAQGGEGGPAPFPSPPASQAGPGRRTLRLALVAVVVTLAGAGTVVFLAMPSKSTLKAIERPRAATTLPGPAAPAGKQAPPATPDNAVVGTAAKVASAPVPPPADPAVAPRRTASLPESPMAPPAPKAMRTSDREGTGSGATTRTKGRADRRRGKAGTPATTARPEAKSPVLPPSVPHSDTLAVSPPSAAVAPPPAAVVPSAPSASAAPRPAEPSGRSRLIARFNEGVSAQGRADWPTAESAFGDVVTLEPSLVEGWNGLGVARMRQGKTAEAGTAFAKAVALDPSYAPALVNAGLLSMQNGHDPEEGARYFARAAAADPGSPAPRVNLAIAQSRAGKMAEAEATLLDARRRFPGSPDVLYHLGSVYDRTGDRMRARAAWAAMLDAAHGTRPELEAPVRERMGVR
jgi:Flp pilus assembly protein TadD